MKENRLLFITMIMIVLMAGTGCIANEAAEKPTEPQTEELTDSQTVLTEEKMELAEAPLEPCPITFSEPHYLRNNIGDEKFYVQLINNSDQPVKEVHFSVVLWDNNNLPIKVWFGGDDYLDCYYDNAMAPGETSPSNWSWNIYNQSGKDIAYSVIVVERVMFFEKEDWVNTLYAKELEQYVGKIRKE